MQVRTAIAILILLAGFVAGCGGGSAATGAAKRGGTGPEEEAGGLIEVEGPEPEGELLAGEEGWVRTSAGVFWTADGGRSWRPITLPVPVGGAIGSVYFADARRGWALNEPGREGYARPSIYMTTDGGRTWRHTRLRAYDKFVMPAVEASFSLVDGHELFALLRASGDRQQLRLALRQPRRRASLAGASHAAACRPDLLRNPAPRLARRPQPRPGALAHHRRRPHLGRGRTRETARPVAAEGGPTRPP
jgi:hypothetical protein